MRSRSMVIVEVILVGGYVSERWDTIERCIVVPRSKYGEKVSIDYSAVIRTLYL
jgi:hypothetical protein